MRTTAHSRAVAALLLAGAALLTAAGCNIVVPIAYAIEGPPSTEAAYTLPQKKAVVFFDDTKNQLPRTSLRTRIGDKVAADLMAKGMLTQVIASREAMQIARRKDTDSNKIGIGTVGQEVGAELVIYVKITGFFITPDGYTNKPEASAEVKVVDVGASRRVFPEDGTTEDGFPVNATTREVDNELYKSSSGRRKIEDSLADVLADKVAKTFYKHETKELGAPLGVR